MPGLLAQFPVGVCKRQLIYGVFLSLTLSLPLKISKIKKTCLHKNLYMHLHSSTIHDRQKVETQLSIN